MMKRLAVLTMLAVLVNLPPVASQQERARDSQAGELVLTQSASAQVVTSETAKKKVAVVLVGHGVPASDFPREKLGEFRRLTGQVMAAGGEEKAPSELVARLQAVEREVRQWKRTPENDPYNATVQELAARIKQAGGYDLVEVAHNEACGLDVDEAIDAVIQKGATRVIVLTTMIIKGGAHAEHDIARKVERAKQAHPQVSISYVWPIETDQVVQFFVAQLNRFRP